MNSSNNNEIDQNDTTQNTVKNSAANECCGIYGLRCKTTGKWYVGQTKNKFKSRWNAYRRGDVQYQHKLRHALEKYGFDDFECVILEVCPKDKEILNVQEVYWIQKYNSIENGYNIRAGGVQGEMSLESRTKMSNAKKGKKFSEEHKANMRKPKSPEHVEKVRQSLLKATWPKGVNVGEKNGNYGKFWITNDIDSKMIRPSENIPDGWRKGKKPKLQPKGKDSPSYGMRWITNGLDNRLIKSDEIVSDGWIYGRTVQ
jgi:group I intron endonuclease